MHYYKAYLTGADEKADIYEEIEAESTLEALSIAQKINGGAYVWRLVKNKEMEALMQKEEQKKKKAEGKKKMAAKKDFTANTSKNKVLSNIAEATQEIPNVQEAQEDSHIKKERKTYTEQETQEFQSNLQTSGRKGVKLPRINMAFIPEVYDYIKSMSRATGMTYTEFVNHEMKKSLETHRDDYQKIINQRMSL